MLTISGEALGRKRPLFADFSVPPPQDVADGGSTTLRQLIGSIVRYETAAFRQRQADRQLFRVLTAREIDDGAQRGKIESGGSEIEPREVDDDQAVGTALQAFEDGMFLTVVDGETCRDLDMQLFLQPDSRVTFVRLTLLAGG